MNISDFKLNRTFFINTEKFFGKEFGSDYYHDKWSKYYPDSILNNLFWYPANPIVKWMYDSAQESNIQFREFMLRYSEFLFENNLYGTLPVTGKFTDTKSALRDSSEAGKYYSNWADLQIIQNLEGMFCAQAIVPRIFCEFYLYGIEGIIRALLKRCNNQIIEFKNENRESFFVDGIEFVKITFEVRYE